jgi:hypothetical protein
LQQNKLPLGERGWPKGERLNLLFSDIGLF